jgi:hypothetical protein
MLNIAVGAGAPEINTPMMAAILLVGRRLIGDGPRHDRPTAAYQGRNPDRSPEQHTRERLIAAIRHRSQDRVYQTRHVIRRILVTLPGS